MLWLAILGLVTAGLIYHWTRSSGIHRHGRRLAQPSDPIPQGPLLLDWFLRQQEAFNNDTYEIFSAWNPFFSSTPASVVISKPENIEFVLEKSSSSGRGAFFTTRTWDFFGYNGIINASGSLARVQRHVGLSFFTAEQNVNSLVSTVLPDVYSSTIQPTLARHAQTKEPLDLQRILRDLTTEVIRTIIYEGDDEDENNDGKSPITRPSFIEALDYASDSIGRRLFHSFRNPLCPLRSEGDKLRAAIKQVKSSSQRIIQRARKRRTREAFASLCDNTEPPQFASLVDMLIESLGGGGGATATEVVADSALNFFSCARESTAQWLVWTIYAVIMHSSRGKVLARVLAEINTLPGLDKLQAADLAASRIPYTAAVLQETLRLYPSVPLQMRQNDSHTVLPDGTTLPPNTLVIWCLWAINRSTAIWGDDAHVFRPERWLDHDQDQDQNQNQNQTTNNIGKNSNKLFVFGSGPRDCIGREMAWLIVAWTLVVVLREFSFTPTTTTPLPPTTLSASSSSSDSSASRSGSERFPLTGNLMTLKMQDGLWVRVDDRQGQRNEKGAPVTTTLEDMVD